MSDMNKRPTPTRILDAAQALIMKEGFKGVSVDQIIESAGVSKGSFFYHFSSKEVLARCLLERFFEQQGVLIESEIKLAHLENADPIDRLLHVISTIEKIFLGNSQSPGCVMASFSYQLFNDIPELRQISHDALNGWNEVIGGLISEALPAQDKQDGPELAEYLMCCLQGGMVVGRVHGSRESLNNCVKHFTADLRRRCAP